MTDPLRGRATAFLLRIGLLTGLLSIIAGIFGMHVLGAGHSMHATAVVSPSAVVSQSHAVRTADSRAAQPHKAAVQSPASLPASTCASSGTCTAMSAMNAVCVPAPSHNTLAAPLPGVPPYANEGTAEAGAPSAGYSHRPACPSPGDLCISRT